jgi:CMP-N-acetylneuraminic acid synthetase/spore coat polysaccharide biosynthesis predicted glycosyltransferase SpsG
VGKGGLQMKNVIAVIPARGGSKGIPRKNLRPLLGHPLISYTIKTALNSKSINKVIVTTDDDEIAYISRKYGAEVIERPNYLATDEVPLDPVIFDVVRRLEDNGEKIDIILTIQPTSPLLSSETIEQIVDILKGNEIDTVITAVDNRHLSWTKDNESFVPKYNKRLNRQYLPSEYRETGAVLATKRFCMSENNRIGDKVSLFEVDKFESIDIDSPIDWWVVEKLLKRKKIVIRVDGFKEIGLGHIYRTLSIANNIMDHEVIFLMNGLHDLGIQMVQSQNYQIELFYDDPIGKIKELNPDIVINDILDTTKDYIISLKKLGIKVFNFEDLGPGAEYSDGVFNALYPGAVPYNHFYMGEKYYIARDEFLHSENKRIEDKVENVLITFGGTDPNNLSLKTLKAISDSAYLFDITIIVGPGYIQLEELESEVSEMNRRVTILRKVNNMAEHMLAADIIFSSAGRTMYEIAMIGTPAIIISQNYREVTHFFGHSYNGFVNLGIHSEVVGNEIYKSFHQLIENVDLRKNMHERMIKHNLREGLNRVFSIIFNN